MLKVLSCRNFIVCLDFLTICLFTGKVRLALGFMIVRNICATLGYFLHERVWSRVRRGTGDS